MTPPASGTGTIRRSRATKAETRLLDDAVQAVVAEHSSFGAHPVTCRQAYYLSVVAGLVPKNDKGYRKVVERLSLLREDGRLPWAWIADNARSSSRYSYYRDLDEAVMYWKWGYKRDHWAAQPTRVEVWVESDSIASALQHAVLPKGVELSACKGQSSKSFIHEAARRAVEEGKPTVVLYCGDHDPSGLQIDLSLEERYRRCTGGDLSLEVRRIAVTVEHVRRGLPSSPAKTSDPNYRRFHDHCTAHGIPVEATEAEALPPAELRQLVTDAIDALIDHEAWQESVQLERDDKQRLEGLLR